MNIRTWNLISAGVGLVGAVLFGVQCWLHKSLTLIAVLGLFIFTIGIVIGSVKVRCPFCRHGLGLLSVGRFCPHCGYDLGEKTNKESEI